MTATRVEEFMVYRRSCGRAHRCSPRALAALLGFLRGLSVAPIPAPAQLVTASDRLLATFEEYLLRDRGLSELTVAGYRRVAATFLTSRFADGELRLERLTAADVSAFMLAQSTSRSPGALSTTVTGLRALLRFLFVRGYTPCGSRTSIGTTALYTAVSSDYKQRALAAAIDGQLVEMGGL